MAEKACIHCQSPVPAGLVGSVPDDFCCAGCAAVHALLVDGRLTRYYDLARGDVLPASDATRERSHAWLEPILAKSAEAEGPICSAELDVQGLHCAACVWLMNELFRRREGGAAFTVNPALGKAQLSWQRDRFDVGAFLGEVERFGYLFGPSRKQAQTGSRELVVRLGVCVAATMNVMLFSLSFYFGLSAQDPATFSLFTRLSLLLATGVVAVGGWPFFRGAWLALRRGVLHLDLPIALGILLVYGLSVMQSAQGRGDHAYLDTLCTFVTLMVVGRWLQQRVLDRNRHFLLQDDGADALPVRRREGQTVAVVPAARIAAGDRLVLAPGDLVPVQIRLETRAELQLPAGFAEGGPREARFSLDWITGEPHARSFAGGATVPAGAFNAGRFAVEAIALEPFADSTLPRLLSAKPPDDRQTDSARFFDRLARGYVVAVLGLATAGFFLWLSAGTDRAIDVAAALLVVTCPCALGIAIPLAYELAQAGLRRKGILVRRGDLLDRLARVTAVVFDKTGTLTLGRLELTDPAALAALPDGARDAAYDLASRSNHPVSRCLAEALARLPVRADAAAQVCEEPGRGLELSRGGARWRLGAEAWATGAAGAAATGTATASAEAAAAATATESADSGEDGPTTGAVLSRDGALVARFELREAVRPGAARELSALAQQGKAVWLLSGDAPARVAPFARALSVPADRAIGGLSPAEKAAHVERLEAEGGAGATLFLGDGVNDALAFAAASCAGTPAIDRPVMPGKADFFLVGEDLGQLDLLFATAARLRTTVNRILALAFTYNALTIATCLAGLMTPLGAAVAMPLSSLSVLLFAAQSVAGARPTSAPTGSQPGRPARTSRTGFAGAHR